MTETKRDEICPHGFSSAHKKHCKDCEHLDEIAEKDAEIEYLNNIIHSMKVDAAQMEYKDLESKLKLAVEALELISSPSEFNCAIGEGNLRAAANNALAKIRGEA